ncbi:MAG: NAD(P)/FAD-dependent oxidoreductase [Bacteroidota bacterium]
MSDTSPIIIVGAGLCGSLLALRLAQRGYRVELFEKRSDPRSIELEAGRSINLALSARGLMALERAGLRDEVREICIPMRGRMIHPLGGDSFLSPYSGRAEDYINSISRPGLNQLLIEAADEHEGVRIHFDTQVEKVYLDEGKVDFRGPSGHGQTSGQIVVGTDGAGSVVRRAMMAKTTDLLFNYEQNFLRHGYKELSIHPGQGDNLWQIHKEALHIWPRGHFMIIALPNLDGSFTLTMFHPYDGEAGFNNLKDRDARMAFFEKYYPSLLPYIPHLHQEYETNPTATLGTIRCYPWQAYGRTVIMGDAAHAIVPFYGQGMNASFEDVRVFDELLETHGNDWSKLLYEFQETRKPNGDAIADLALENFIEMRDKVDDANFRHKRMIEMQLEREKTDYYSKYSLVTFRPDLSYAEARQRGLAQDEFLLNLKGDEELDWVYGELMKG